MTRRLRSSRRTPPRENDPRGYGGLGISQATLDVCHAWMDPGSLVARTSRAGVEAFLAEPFTGATTDGTVVPGLYPLRDTGLSTAHLKGACDGFLATLRPEMRAAAMFPVDADELRAWINANEWANRHGAFLRDMGRREREAFENLLRASLSAAGSSLIRDVTRRMSTWAKSSRTPKILNEWTYWVSVFGRPSLTEPWGWQLDGHHVNLNVFVLRAQVVISPVFVRAEPRTCGTGKFAGTSVLTEFDEPAVALMEALSGGQRQRAVLHPSILSPYHGKPTAARRDRSPARRPPRPWHRT